jgi:pimeloyl-ACP methyl ester carboxylesterase
MTPPEPVRRFPGAQGVEIATYHLGGEGPPVLLLHATGFHGRCWLPLAPALTDQFSVWSIDLRGHGSSGKAPDRRYDDWTYFVDDLFAVLDSLGLQGWRGVGHSLGGAVLLLAEQRHPGTFAALCLYEPVVMPPKPPGEGVGRAIPMGDVVRKRRASFPSRLEARQNFAAKPPMNRFDPAALDAYVTYGLVDVPDGTVTLACTREDEATIYDGAPRNQVWEGLPDVRPPVTVLGGFDPDHPISQSIGDIAGRMPCGEASRLEGLSHFGPFEEPLRVGRIAATALRSAADRAPGDESPTTVAPPR